MSSKTSSSKSSSKKDGKIKSKSVDKPVNMFNDINLSCEQADLEKNKGSASVSCFFKKEESSYDHSTVTDYFKNQFSPFAPKEMTIKGKKQVFPDDRRTNMRQQLTDDDASIKTTKQLNSYDMMTADNKTIILSEKLAGHYHQNPSITTSKPSFDPSKPEKDCSEKNYVKFHLKTKNEFWYNEEKLVGENEKIIKKAEYDYYVNYKSKNKDEKGRVYDGLKIAFKFNGEEVEVYAKDIEKKTRILTTVFYREKELDDVPKDKNGELITPDKCTKKAEDGTTIIDNSKIVDIYGVPPEGTEIGYASDFDKILKTFAGVQLFVRYHYHLEKINIGKNPQDETGFQNIYFLRKVDIIKIKPKDSYNKKYDNSFSSFCTDPEDLKKFSETREVAAVAATATNDKKIKSDTDSDVDNKSFKDALISDTSKNSVKDKKDGSDSDSSVGDKDKDSDSDSNSDDEDKDKDKDKDSDSESDINDKGKDDNSDSDSDDEQVDKKIVPVDSDSDAGDNDSDSDSDDEEAKAIAAAAAAKKLKKESKSSKKDDSKEKKKKSK